MHFIHSIRAISVAALAWAALCGTAMAQVPLPPPLHQPGMLQSVKPTPISPGGAIQLPNRPLDAKPLPSVTPFSPSLPTLKAGCSPGGDPVKATLTIVPQVVRSGMPVEMHVRTVCPVGFGARQEFTGQSTGTTDRAGGDTMMAFLRQIPANFWPGGTTELVIRFTPTGLGSSVPVTVFTTTVVETLPDHRQVRIKAPAANVRIEGDGAPAAPPPAREPPPPPLPPRCDPTISLNAVPTAVIGGSLVPVDITLSCALPTEAVVQIISSNVNLLPNPPGGTVRMPANTTRFQVQLQAQRVGTGSVTLRAVLSQPAGRMSETDTVLIQN